MARIPALVNRGVTIGLTEAEYEALGKHLDELRRPSLGRVAYEAYGNEVGWKTYQGLPMLSWDGMPLILQRGWQEAAIAVIYRHESDGQPSETR